MAALYVWRARPGAITTDQGKVVRCRRSGATAKCAVLAVLFGVALASGLGAAHGLPGGGEITLVGEPAPLDVGGHWVIQFAVAGEHNLVVWGVNGTSLGEDLEFVELRHGGGGEIAPAGGSGGSLTFGGFGGEQTAGYLVVRALTPGDHYLKMEFGDGVAYADNYASMVEVVSPGGDAVYGEKDAVRIELVFSGPVTVDLNGISQGATDAAGNVFDALDHPVSVATAVIGGKTYAVVASSGSAGVQIIDITDPANPIATASILDDQPGNPTEFETLAAPEGIATATIDGRAYALVTSLTDNGVQIIDITDPANPIATASILDDTLANPTEFETLTAPEGIATATIDGRAYALVTSFLGGGIQIIDITDPANPIATASIYDDQPGRPSPFDTLMIPKDIATATIDGRAYALVTSLTDNGVQIIDITDPANPIATASVQDDSPGNPTEFDTLAAPEGIATATIDGRAYALVASIPDNGVQIIEITDPAAPAAVSSLTWDWALPFSVEVARIGSGYYALVATLGNSQFAVFNITDPANPSKVALVDRTGLDAGLGYVDSVAAVHVGDGVYALLADRTNDRIHLLDVSNPSIPESPLLPCIILDVAVNGYHQAAEEDPATVDAYPARHAVYESGSGTAQLSFVYKPRHGDASDDLGYVSQDSLMMNGNHLRGPSGQEIIPLLPEPGGPNSLRSNHQIVIDTLPPTAVSAEYSTGKGTLKITFSEPLNGAVQAGLVSVRDGDDLEGAAIGLGNATTLEAAGDTVTAKLSSSQRSAITGMGSPQVDIAEGAVWDRAANPVAAEPALTVTIRDDPPPAPSLSFFSFSLAGSSQAGSTSGTTTSSQNNGNTQVDRSNWQNATVTVHGSSHITVEQGFHADDGATCSHDGDTWEAHLEFTGLRKAPPTVRGNQIQYYYTALGEHTITYTCGGGYNGAATKTVTVEDTPPVFEWHLWPTYLLCYDITDGYLDNKDEHIHHGVLYPDENDVYTCTDSHGHAISVSCDLTDPNENTYTCTDNDNQTFTVTGSS